MGKKGKISLEGYRKNSPDKNNDFNIIPSQYIDMHNVDHDVLMIPMGGRGTGNPVLAKPGERYFFPNHDFVFEQAMPENAMMRYQRIMRNGGPLPKAQMYNSQVGVPLNTNDFIYTPQELEKYKNIYDQRIATCQKGDAACLEQANNYYNLYVAPKLNAPNTWQIAEKMGITTGPNNPRIREYGTAADSWDLPGLYKKAGAKVNLAAPITNPSEIQNKLASMSDEDLKKYWINMNLPLGALVNFGQAGLDEHYGKGQAYNVSQGLVPSNHSARVSGYSPEGVPYIYDYGRITPITDPKFKSMPLTIITSPQEIQGYTFENLKKQGKLEGSKMNPLKINTKGADYDEDEYEPFINSLQKNKDMYANALGMSDEEYNNYAKHAAALALTETGGGDDTAIRWKGIIPVPSYITDKLGFGDTKGITQINPDVLFGKKSLADKLESVGIRKDNYDPWNPDHAAIATLALLKDNRPVQDKYAKTAGNKADLSEAEKTYYQWSMPRTLRKGDAKGESEKVKKYLENYNKIQADFDAHNRYLAENRKFGGGLHKAQTGIISEKPWGEMTPQEKAAYLDAKEKKKPMSKAQADAWAKQAEAKSRAQAKKEYYEDYVREGTKKALTHPLLNYPTSFIPEGMAVQMLQSAANYPMHLANDEYGMAALDLAGAIPFSGRLAQTVKGAGKKVIPAATKQVEKLFKAPTFLQSVDDLKTLKTSNKFKNLNTGQAYFQKLGAESLQEALTKRNVNLQSVNDIYETLGSDAEKTKFLNHLYDVVQGSKVEKAVRSADEVLGSIAGTVLGRDATAPDLQTVVNAANKKLAKGLGIKKGDMPISLEVNKNEPYRVDVKLGDRRTGYLNLSPVGTKDSKLSQILKGEKPKMAKNYSDYLNFVNAPKPGFAKSADFPFDYTDLQGHPYKDINLKGQGYSAELNEAINRSLKEKGARLYSGSTGHTPEGAARYANLLQKGLVENISPRIPGSYNLKYPNNPLYMYKRYGGTPMAQDGRIQATPTYPSGKEQNTLESMPVNRRNYEQALADQLAQKQLADAKLAMNVAGLVFYPAAAAASAVDFSKGDYGQGLAGLVPFVGTASKANTARNILNQASRNLLTKSFNAGIPYKLAAPIIKGAKKSIMYGANAVNVEDAYSAFNEHAYGGDPSLPAITGHYRKGGRLPNKRETNKNIKSSINNLMRRNETLFGPSGRNFYNPNPMSKYYKGGIAFPQQPTAGDTKGQQESEFYSPNWIPPGPVGFYEHGGIAYPQLPTEDYFFSGSPWMPHYEMGGLPGGANNMPCYECGGYMENGGPTPVSAMDANAWLAKNPRGFSDSAPKTEFNWPTFKTRSEYDKFVKNDPNLSLYSREDLEALGLERPVGVDPEAIKRQKARQEKLSGYIASKKYGGYYEEGGFMTPENMTEYPVFYNGGYPMMYADGGASMGYDQDDITDMMRNTFLDTTAGNVQNVMAQQVAGNAMQNIMPYMTPQARYGAAYIPKAQKGIADIPEESLLNPQTLRKAMFSTPAKGQSSFEMSPELEAKRKAFYDASAAYDQTDKYMRQQLGPAYYNQGAYNQGMFAPGYQTMQGADMFGNTNYRVGRVGKGMENFIPYLMANPQLSALKRFDAKKQLFGPGARRITMDFETAYNPQTGQVVQLPKKEQTDERYLRDLKERETELEGNDMNFFERMKAKRAAKKAGKQASEQQATSPFAQSPFHQGYPARPYGPAENPAYSYGTPAGGTTFGNNMSYAPATFNPLDSYPNINNFDYNSLANDMKAMERYNPTSTSQMGASGMKYEEGGFYDLTEDEIQQIMAAGGSVTYLD